MPAHMIPPVPKDFDEKSNEGIVFKALRKLPEDFYVFHSVVVNDVINNNLVEREIDFVVVNRKKGVLCIEAKNGSGIQYYDRFWHYTSGTIMKHGGPYNQAATAKRALRSRMLNHPNYDVKRITYRCKMLHAAWFFGMSRETFQELNNQGLPEDAIMDLTLFAEDIADPTETINRMFHINIPIDEESRVQTEINSDEFQMLLESVFCPEFNLVPSPTAKSKLIEEQMNQLLYEQYRLLDYLEDQDTAVINGAAGTGKTMLAVEKARRSSVDEERVLFLCYNRLLCNHLNDRHKKAESKSYRKQFKNVDFMTISQLAKKLTGNYKDYDGLLNWLLDCLDNPDQFGYKHVIVDEGQDFGIIQTDSDRNEAEKNCSIIDVLQEVALEQGGTFYIFYDKYQMIQGGGHVEYKLPDCITNSDCRLSLHYNCRNTKEIAQTSVTPLKDYKNRAIKPKTACTWFDPVKPVMHLVGSEKKAVKTLNAILAKYQETEVKDVVILTPGTIEFCCIADELSPKTEINAEYDIYIFNGISYKVTTCIKFKGLEADAIVMIDLNKNSFTGYKGSEFYVGTSRAKQYLDMVAQITPSEYKEVISTLDLDAPIKNDPEKMRKVLGSIFSADVEID